MTEASEPATILVAAAGGLWNQILSHPASLITDLVILAVLGFVHVIAWVSTDTSGVDPENKGGDAVRSAAAAGLTVVGILLPVTLLIVQLADSKSQPTIPQRAVEELFVASCWLLGSLIFGLYTLFVSVTRGLAESPLRRRDIGITFGFQLIFMLIGIVQIVWGFSTVASRLVS